MREEWRAEQDAATRDAAEQWRHARTLLDVARDHMHRGDRIAITVAGHRAVGEVLEVARDRVALLDVAINPGWGIGESIRVDVQVTAAVPLALALIERAQAGGRSATNTSTFRARLLELEAAGSPVAVATTASADPFVGWLSVGADMVAVTSDTGIETVIALSAIASVSPAPG
jgi:hypothetical protein